MDILYLGAGGPVKSAIKQQLTQTIGEDIAIESANSFDNALAMVDRKEYDIIILCKKLAWMDGMQALQKLLEKSVFCPIIFVGPDSSDDFAVEALKSGAYDYFSSNQIKSGRFIQSIKNLCGRLRAEKALKRASERYRMIFENTAVAIMIADESERIISWNGLTERILDMHAQDLFLKKVESLYPPDEWKRIRDSNIRQKGLKAHMETKMIRGAGDVIDVDLSLSILNDAQGNITGSIGVVSDITQRKSADRLRDESERKYMSLVESSADPIYQVDRRLRFIHANKRYLERVNVSLEDLLGSEYSKIHPESGVSLGFSDEFAKKAEAVFESGKPIRYEHRSLRDQRYFLRTLSPVFTNDGNVESIIVNSKDITDEKNVQNELMKFKRAVEQSPNTVMITDTKGDIEFVNPRFCQTTGYDMCDVIGQRSSIVKSGMTPNEVYQRLWDSISQAKQWSGELLNKKRDGSLIWEEVLISPIKGKDGKVSRFLCLKQDITQRREAEIKLRELEEFFENIAYSINSAIAVVDKDGKVLTWNEKASMLWGISKEDALGNSIYDIEFSQWLAFVPQSLMQSVEDGQERRDTDIGIFDKNGCEIFIDIAYNPLYDSKKGIIGGIAFAYDVTERNMAKKEIIRLDRMKDEFLSITTHELKTPLTPIKMQVEMWMGGLYGQMDENQKKSFEIMHRNCIREIRLISDIMTISKLDQKKLGFHMGRVDLSRLLLNVRDDMQEQAREKGIGLYYEMPEDDVIVSADEHRLMQVVVDLVNNAIKFTQNGGITLRLEKSGENAQVEVQDTGIGIPEKEIGHIFERFYQVDHSITRRYYGSGLGLSIAKGIIEEHRGRIWAKSRPGEGTTFIFTIPLME